MNESDRQTLLAHAAAGELTPEEGVTLLAACREDRALLEQLASVVAIERLMHAVGTDPDGELATREVVARIKDQDQDVRLPSAGVIVRAVEEAHRLLWLRRLAWVSAVALGLIVAVAGSWWHSHEVTAVATIVRVEGVKWKGAEPLAKVRPGARLVADRGLFELKFETGADVVVEAPADLEIEGPGRVYLHTGRAVATVPKQARGFTLDSPRGPLVDLGTEFGVAVGANGTTEVHVLDGIVEASLNQAQPVRLRETEALRATGNATQRLHADEGAFVTTLPPVTNRPPGFIHWSFDDRDTQIFANTGRNLGEGGDTRLFSKYLQRAKGSGPKVVPGRFGNAIELDGVSAYAESPFPGIAGGQARSIAFWLKLPHDFRTDQGYGIIGWGQINVEGAAWQISANPAKEAGELGRLRVGTRNGYVVGTTDLRDDKWHHCAVVMYGGPRPTTGTHILLYVDGQIEPSPRKSVQEIATVPSERHGVWLGRNLAFTNDWDRNVGLGPFFRGSVDEVYIFDGALSQRDVETLMDENTPP